MRASRKGSHSLGLIGLLEQVDEGFALCHQRGGMRAVAGGLHQALARRDAGRTLLAGALCPGDGQRARLARADHLFHQADAVRGGGIQTLTEQDHALGPALADQARQVLGAAGARQQADAGFR